MSIVYEAFNLKNGKRYIGATDKTLRIRRGRHIANARRGAPGLFYNAIRKHGPEAFIFSVVTSCRDFWHALEEERRFIGNLKPEYNLTDGGGGVRGFAFSAESRAKMSASARRRWDSRTPDVLASYKINQPKLTPAERSEVYARVGKQLAERVSRPVRCISSGATFASCAEAARHFGVSTASIVLYCQGKVRSKVGISVEYAGGSR